MPMAKQAVAVANVGRPAEPADYDGFMAAVQKRFQAAIGGRINATPTVRPSLFVTELNGTDALCDAYLSGLPPEDRRHHTCSCCKQFFRRYGDLVTIDEFGRATSALWDENFIKIETSDGYYTVAVNALQRAVEAARVRGVFLAAEKSWGTPVTGVWTHMAVVPPPDMLYKKRGTATPFQRMAELREDRATLLNAMADIREEHLDQALTLLETDALYRSEKVRGPAQWLKTRYVERSNTQDQRRRENLIWRAVAVAPPGFAKPRGAMIGTLLEDIASGMPFDDCARRFRAKMDPLQYQRPQAAPTAQNIARAEKLVEELGIQPSLERRFLRPEEVVAVWRPKNPRQGQSKGSASGPGVFGHLDPKGKSTLEPNVSLQAPATKVTWVKFRDTVLGDAVKIELYMPSSRLPYVALVTAVHADAPPIIQWDLEGARCPVSWYLWANGSTPEEIGLMSRAWAEVEQIALSPWMWGGDEAGFKHQGRHVTFLLKGAKDSRAKSAGAALFPEILKNELREVRSTIEAYSRRATLVGVDMPMACGLNLKEGGREKWTCTARVTRTDGRMTVYDLDRWD
jgi:hypothetical protein